MFRKSKSIPYLRIRSWLIQKRWLIRLSLTYLLTSVILTSFLVMFISRVVSTQMVNTTDANNRELLSQVNLTLDYTLADLYSEFVHLWRKDPSVLTVLNASGQNTKLPLEIDALISERLNYAVSQASLVNSAFLISYPQNRVWSNLGQPTSLAKIQDQSALDFINSRVASSSDTTGDLFFDRQAQILNGDGLTQLDSLSFLFIHRQANGNPSEILLVNLDRIKLENLIQKHLDSGIVNLVSPSGRIIAQTSNSMNIHNLSDILIHPETVTAILGSKSYSDSVIAQTASGQSLVTWQRAEKMSFFIIDVVPLSSLSREANTINRLIGIYFLITLVISLIAGLLAVRYLYKPLQSLVKNFGSINPKGIQLQLDEFSLLESAYHRFESKARDRTIFELLSGKVTQEAEDIFPKSIQQWIVIAIMPSHSSSYLPAMIEPALETIRTELICPVILRSEDNIVALLGLPADPEKASEIDRDDLRQTIEDLLVLLAKMYQTDLVAGLGASVTRISESRISLRQALVAANQAQLSIEGKLSADDSMFSRPIVIFYDDLGLNSPANETLSPPRQAIDYIQRHLEDANLNLEEVAREVGISSGYLRQLFKQETGQTLSDFLIDARIRRASNLLSETNLTAREISAAVGIQDSRYFYTVFKKKTGMTTEAYRQLSRHSDV